MTFRALSELSLVVRVLIFVDPSLNNEVFAGRARQIPRYRYCLADMHASQEVSTPLQSHCQASRMVVSLGRHPPTAGFTNRPVSAEICRLFNSLESSRCRFLLCRYENLCVKCRWPHSVVECGDWRQQPASSGNQPATSKTCEPSPHSVA